MDYPGVYRAKCVKVSGDTLHLYIPQVFATTQVLTNQRTGAIPAADTSGWVMFEGGKAEYPVWLSTSPSSGPAPVPPRSVFLAGTLSVAGTTEGEFDITGGQLIGCSVEPSENPLPGITVSPDVAGWWEFHTTFYVTSEPEDPYQSLSIRAGSLIGVANAGFIGGATGALRPDPYDWSGDTYFGSASVSGTYPAFRGDDLPTSVPGFTAGVSVLPSTTIAEWDGTVLFHGFKLADLDFRHLAEDLGKVSQVTP